MWHRVKWFYFVIVAAVCLSSVINTFEVSITNVNASIGSTENVTAIYPKLFATKIADKTKVYLGEAILITITIANFGNQTAFNVTFIDQNTNVWIFEIFGLTELSYREIKPNESRQFSYLITPKLVGNFNIPSARIEYYDSEINPSKFVHVTNRIGISVEEPPEDFSLNNFYVAIIFLLIIVILDIILIIKLIAPKLNRRLKKSDFT